MWQDCANAGESSTLPLTLSNTGDAPLTLNGGSLDGANAAAFSFSAPAGTELAPGESTVVQISFAPLSEGQKSAGLDFTHNGENSPSSIALSGTASAVNPGEVKAVRINSGGSPYSSSQGHTWAADQHFVGGHSYYDASIELPIQASPTSIASSDGAAISLAIRFRWIPADTMSISASPKYISASKPVWVPIRLASVSSPSL